MGKRSGLCTVFRIGNGNFVIKLKIIRHHTYITVLSGNNEVEKELDETRAKEMHRRNCDGNAKIMCRMDAILMAHNLRNLLKEVILE